MKVTPLVAALLATALPSIAMAQMSGDVTLGFGRTDVQDLGTDISTAYLAFSTDLTLGSNVTAGIDLDFLRASATDFDVDADLRNFAVDVAYSFGNGFSAGAYAQKTELSASLFGFDLLGDLSATSLGLSGGYSAEGVDVAVFAGKTSTDPSLPDGWDIRDMGISARVTPTEQVALGASFIRSTLDTPGEDISMNSLGVAGGISLSETWSLFAGVSRADFGDFDIDVTGVGIGVAYAMPYFPGTIFAEVSRATLSAGAADADLDTVQVGVTFPLGGGKTSIPDGTVAGSILSENYSSAVQGLRTSF